MTPGPPALGSAYRLMTRYLGRSLALDYRIEEIDPPRRVVLGAETALFRSTDAITVSRGRRRWGRRHLRGHPDHKARRPSSRR